MHLSLAVECSQIKKTYQLLMVPHHLKILEAESFACMYVFSGKM